MTIHFGLDDLVKSPELAKDITETYCGLDCGLLLEQLEKILDQCRTHAEYDIHFAPKMVQKLIDRCEEVKSELMIHSLQLP